MSLYGTPPDSYWEPPEPDYASVWEESNEELDNLVGEWSDFAEVEVYAEVEVSAALEVDYVLHSVRRDGQVIEYGDVTYSSIEELRAHLQQVAPLDPDADR